MGCQLLGQRRRCSAGSRSPSQLNGRFPPPVDPASRQPLWESTMRHQTSAAGTDGDVMGKCCSLMIYVSDALLKSQLQPFKQTPIRGFPFWIRRGVKVRTRSLKAVKSPMLDPLPAFGGHFHHFPLFCPSVATETLHHVT